MKDAEYLDPDWEPLVLPDGDNWDEVKQTHYFPHHNRPRPEIRGKEAVWVDPKAPAPPAPPPAMPQPPQPPPATQQQPAIPLPAPPAALAPGKPTRRDYEKFYVDDLREELQRRGVGTPQSLQKLKKNRVIQMLLAEDKKQNRGDQVTLWGKKKLAGKR